ncbi:MAG: ATP-dependent helicase [Chthoniobacter sp.]|jgi:ATP-dependent RNA helicase SUPV3L1/SUV3|nr:ATP-dependent helicase [Chthoniobacter sp.]
MPAVARHSSSFSRTEFDQWLAQRRAEEGLEPPIPQSGRPIFKSWLRDAWEDIRELPEAQGLGLFCERDVTMIVSELFENVVIGGHPCSLNVFEILPLNRPKRADVLSARLRQLSGDARRRGPAIQAEILAQIPRIEHAIAENRDRLDESDIRGELRKIEGRISVRQFIDGASRVVRELSLRAANHRMAEGIALHRFHETFPGARARARELLFIAGPTNSGKTYAAFQKLAAASTGVYLAPLRLMAAEFWDRMRGAGVPCSLITGEERIPDPEARHISSTIEMLATDAEYDVAIIDEVQMIADKDRGWAWTQAIVGVNAKLVILVGSPDAENVLREIATRLGEPLEVQRTERLTPLEVADLPLDPDKKAEAGSAFISFSRRDVLAWKQTLGASDCAAVYGALSPEVRREEARRFTAGEAKIVSATDAIGMGLNLPVKTIVFTTLTKWDGEQEITLGDSAIRQIAGRAGRFGMHEVGVVTALNKRDLDRIREAMAAAPEPLATIAPIAPHMKMLEFLAQETGRSDLPSLLDCFAALPGDTDLFCKADVSSMRELAGELGEISLPLSTQFALCACPVDTRSGDHMRIWRQWVAAVAEEVSSPLPRGPMFAAGSSTTSPIQLQGAEGRVRLLAAYRWMHHRMPELFPDIDEALAVSSSTNQFISNSLKKKSVRRCRRCGHGLPDLHKFAICEPCFAMRFERND